MIAKQGLDLGMSIAARNQTLVPEESRGREGVPAGWCSQLPLNWEVLPTVVGRPPGPCWPLEIYCKL
jgi:hypothetical protein